MLCRYPSFMPFRSLQLATSNTYVKHLAGWLSDMGLGTALDFTNWRFLVWCRDSSPMFDYLVMFAVSPAAPVVVVIILLVLRRLHWMCVQKEHEQRLAPVHAAQVTFGMSQRRIAGGILFFPLVMYVDAAGCPVELRSHVGVAFLVWWWWWWWWWCVVVCGCMLCCCALAHRYAVLARKVFEGLMCSDSAFCNPDRQRALCSGSGHAGVVAIAVVSLFLYLLGVPVGARWAINKYATRLPTDPKPQRVRRGSQKGAGHTGRRHHKKGGKKHKKRMKRLAAGQDGGATAVAVSVSPTHAATSGSDVAYHPTSESRQHPPASSGMPEGMAAPLLGAGQKRPPSRGKSWLTVDPSPVDYLTDVR